MAKDLASSIIHNLCESREYLCLSNFLIIAINVASELEELDEYTVFIVDKVYGRDSVSGLYSICLFDSYHKPTVGFITDNSLELFQDIPLGRLRLSYVPKTIDLETNTSYINKFASSVNYHFCADISTDGNNWQPFMHGTYKQIY